MSESTAPAPTAPTAAPKPAAPAKAPAKPAKPTRRFFLFSLLGSWFTVAWVTFTATMVGMTLATVRFLFNNAPPRLPNIVRGDDATGYEEDRVTDRLKDQGVWIIRSRQGDSQGRDVIYALSTTCTHLGCTPNWLEAEKKFKCPCHGSGFKISGVNFEGPAPRPLERYKVERDPGGRIIVDKAQKFQKELGQWDNPASYIEL